MSAVGDRHWSKLLGALTIRVPFRVAADLIAPRFVCGVFGIVFLAELWFFFRYGFGSLLNSDAAVTALLAEETWSKTSLLPSGWYYGNDDIWILSPQMFALPFVALLGASSIALMLGNLLGLACVGGAMALLAHRLTGRWAIALVLALGICALFSSLQRDAVYVQLAYGWITAKLALLAFLSLRIFVREEGESRYGGRVRWEVFAYAALLFLLAAESPPRAIAYWCLPVAIVCFLHDADILPRRSAARLFALTAGAALAGALLHILLRQHLIVLGGANAFAVKPMDAWGSNLEVLWKGLPLLVGYEPIGLASPTTPDVALALVRLGFFVAVIVGMVMAWRRLPGENGGQVLFLRYTAVMMAVSVVLFVIGNLAVGPLSVRYLMPAALLALIAFMVRILRCLRAEPLRGLVFLTAFATAFCGGGALAAYRYKAFLGPTSCTAPAHICRLLATLRQAQLTHGFATYWNANVTTLAAASAVTVCGASLQPPLSPFRWLVSKDCFDPARYTGRYFYAFTKAEALALDHAAFEAEAGPPVDVLRTDEYDIWVYESGIGNSRLNWLLR